MSATGKKGTKRKISHKTIEFKYEAILKVENGRCTQSEIAEELGINTSTLSTWVKNKKTIKKRFLEDGPKRKSLKTVNDDDTDIEDSRKPEANKKDDDKVTPVKSPPTLDEALDAVAVLIRFFEYHEHTEYELSLVYSLETKLLNMKMKEIWEKKQREL